MGEFESAGHKAAPDAGGPVADDADEVSPQRQTRLVSVLDLTLLDADASGEDLEALAVSACLPGPSLPPVAAVCVFPRHVAQMRSLLAGSPPLVAAVAGAFPHGAGSLAGQLADVAATVASGADEVDVVLDRFALRHDAPSAGRMLTGLVAAAGVPTKVIVESGCLSLDEVALATRLACDAGAAFVKTSTGFAPVGATFEAVDMIASTIVSGGYVSGVKVSGGVSTFVAADRFAAMAERRFARPVDAGWFRLGSSSLVPPGVSGSLGSGY